MEPNNTDQKKEFDLQRHMATTLKSLLNRQQTNTAAVKERKFFKRKSDSQLNEQDATDLDLHSIPSEDVSKALKIVTKPPLVPLINENKSPLKTYLNRKKYSVKNDLVESFALPDEPIVPFDCGVVNFKGPFDSLLTCDSDVNVNVKHFNEKWNFDFDSSSVLCSSSDIRVKATEENGNYFAHNEDFLQFIPQPAATKNDSINTVEKNAKINPNSKKELVRLSKKNPLNLNNTESTANKMKDNPRSVISTCESRRRSLRLKGPESDVPKVIQNENISVPNETENLNTKSKNAEDSATISKTNKLGPSPKKNSKIVTEIEIKSPVTRINKNAENNQLLQRSEDNFTQKKTTNQVENKTVSKEILNDNNVFTKRETRNRKSKAKTETFLNSEGSQDIVETSRDDLIDEVESFSPNKDSQIVVENDEIKNKTSRRKSKQILDTSQNLNETVVNESPDNKEFPYRETRSRHSKGKKEEVTESNIAGDISDLINTHEQIAQTLDKHKEVNKSKDVIDDGEENIDGKVTQKTLQRNRKSIQSPSKKKTVEKDNTMNEEPVVQNFIPEMLETSESILVTTNKSDLPIAKNTTSNTELPQAKQFSEIINKNNNGNSSTSPLVRKTRSSLRKSELNQEVIEKNLKTDLPPEANAFIQSNMEVAPRTLRPTNVRSSRQAVETKQKIEVTPKIKARHSLPTDISNSQNASLVPLEELPLSERLLIYKSQKKDEIKIQSSQPENEDSQIVDNKNNCKSDETSNTNKRTLRSSILKAEEVNNSNSIATDLDDNEQKNNSLLSEIESGEILCTDNKNSGSKGTETPEAMEFNSTKRTLRSSILKVELDDHESKDNSELNEIKLDEILCDGNEEHHLKTSVNKELEKSGESNLNKRTLRSTVSKAEEINSITSTVTNFEVNESKNNTVLNEVKLDEIICADDKNAKSEGILKISLNNETPKRKETTLNKRTFRSCITKAEDTNNSNSTITYIYDSESKNSSILNKYKIKSNAMVLLEQATNDDILQCSNITTLKNINKLYINNNIGKTKLEVLPPEPNLFNSPYNNTSLNTERVLRNSTKKIKRNNDETDVVFNEVKVSPKKSAKIQNNSETIELNQNLPAEKSEPNLNIPQSSNYIFNTPKTDKRKQEPFDTSKANQVISAEQADTYLNKLTVKTLQKNVNKQHDKVEVNLRKSTRSLSKNNNSKSNQEIIEEPLEPNLNASKNVNDDLKSPNKINKNSSTQKKSTNKINGEIGSPEELTKQSETKGINIINSEISSGETIPTLNIPTKVDEGFKSPSKLSEKNEQRHSSNFSSKLRSNKKLQENVKKSVEISNQSTSDEFNQETLTENSPHSLEIPEKTLAKNSQKRHSTNILLKLLSDEITTENAKSNLITSEKDSEEDNEYLNKSLEQKYHKLQFKNTLTKLQKNEKMEQNLEKPVKNLTKTRTEKSSILESINIEFNKSPVAKLGKNEQTMNKDHIPKNSTKTPVKTNKKKLDQEVHSAQFDLNNPEHSNEDKQELNSKIITTNQTSLDEGLMNQIEEKCETKMNLYDNLKLRSRRSAGKSKEVEDSDKDGAISLKESPQSNLKLKQNLKSSKTSEEKELLVEGNFNVPEKLTKRLNSDQSTIDCNNKLRKFTKGSPQNQILSNNNTDCELNKSLTESPNVKLNKELKQINQEVLLKEGNCLEITAKFNKPETATIDNATQEFTHNEVISNDSFDNKNYCEELTQSLNSPVESNDYSDNSALDINKTTSVTPDEKNPSAKSNKKTTVLENSSNTTPHTVENESKIVNLKPSVSDSVCVNIEKDYKDIEEAESLNNESSLSDVDIENGSLNTLVDSKKNKVEFKTENEQYENISLRKSTRVRKENDPEKYSPPLSNLICKPNCSIKIEEESKIENEDILKEIPLIDRKFDVGTLAWGKIGKYPFWPCLITDSPETKTHFKYQKIKTIKTYYHVNFFGDNGRRSWVATQFTLEYKSKNDLEILRQKESRPTDLYLVKEAKLKTWKIAVEEAESLLDKTVAEKLDFFFERFASAKQRKERKSPNHPSHSELIKQKPTLKRKTTFKSSPSSPLKKYSKKENAEVTEEVMDTTFKNKDLVEEKETYDEEQKGISDLLENSVTDNVLPKLKVKPKVDIIPDSDIIEEESNIENEDILEEIPLIDRKFGVGTLAWGKIGKYPFWPCLITDSPETNTHFKYEKIKTIKTYYHVNFFGDNGRRSWVATQLTLEYKSKNDLEILRQKESPPTDLYLVKETKLKTWKIAVEEAESLLDKTVAEKLDFFYERFESAKQRRESKSPNHPSHSKLIKQKPTLKRKTISKSSPSLALKKYSKKENAEVTEEVMVTTFKNKDLVEEKETYDEEQKGISDLLENPVTDNVLPKLRVKPKVVTIPDSDTDSKFSDNSSVSVSLKSQIDLFKRNNLTKGVPKDRVCQICFKPDYVIRCKGKCNGLFHFDCVNKLIQNNSVKDVSASKNNILSSEKVENMNVEIISVKSRNSENVLPQLTLSPSVKKLSLSEQIDYKMKEIMNSVEDKNYGESTDWSSEEVVDYEINPKPLQGDKELQKSASSKKAYKKKTFIKHVTADNVTFTFDTDSSEDSTLRLIEEESPKMLNVNNFKCGFCLSDTEPSCMICHQLSKKGSNIRQLCSYQKCGRYYHPQCLKLWPQTQWSFISTTKHKDSDENLDTFVCPSHVCHTCSSDDPRANTRCSSEKTVKCLLCPATYHSSNLCIPAGSEILTTTQIICPRHCGEDSVGKKLNRHHTINTTWCFICARGGDLICCETCPTSVHANCLPVNLTEDNTFICEDCESGRLPLYDEIVWVKLGAYRWWPALILFPNDIPENVKHLKHSRGEFVVKFFGTLDHYWVAKTRVFLYQEGDQGHKYNLKKKLDTAFSKALQDAAAAYTLRQEFKALKELEKNSSLKPPSYVKIKFNKPVGNVRQIDYNISNTTACECDPNNPHPCGPDSDCINRLLLTECNPEVCPAGERCNNQRFEKREYPPLVPYKTQGRGWGLKSLAPIKKGQFVIEYVGEMIDEQEYQRRVLKMHEQKEENYYFLTVDKDRMIDAGPKGNVARFMNHSCQPNCETQKWTVNGDTRIGLFAAEDIPAEEELTFNYNLECIGEEKKICKCGAPKCSGFIGVKIKTDEPPKKRKKAFKKTKNVIKPVDLIKNKCFICGEHGNVGACNNKICQKYYHLHCVGLDSWPEGGKWICPWHSCNVCTKRTIRCCVRCINSYCPSHSKGCIRHDYLLGFVCFSHDTVNESQQLEIEKLTPVSFDCTTDESTVSSTTSDDDDYKPKKVKPFTKHKKFKNDANNFKQIDNTKNGITINTSVSSTPLTGSINTSRNKRKRNRRKLNEKNNFPESKESASISEQKL